MPVTFWDNEFRLNQSPDGDKEFSNYAVDVMADGRIVAVWNSAFGGGDGDPSGFGVGVRGVILNPDGTFAGPEFVINTTTNDAQYGAAVAVLSDGRFVVTWISRDPGDGGTVGGDTCVRARVYNADGTPALYDGTDDGIGNPTTSDFVVNVAPGVDESNPTIIADESGGFVIAWQGPVIEDGFATHHISFRRFAASGPSAGQQLVTFDNHNDTPAMTRLDDGRFVIAWHTNFADDGAPPGVGGGLRAYIFNADGTLDENVNNGDPVILDYQNLDDQNSVHLATLEDGRFVATWINNSSADDGSSTAIRARVFNADGTPDLDVAGGQDFLVNTTTLHDQRRPIVEALDDGGFLITFWSRSDFEGDSKEMLLGRRYGADGAPEGPNFVVNEGPGTSFGATSGLPNAIVRTPDGRIFVLYNNNPVFPDEITGRFLEFDAAARNESGNAGDDEMLGTGFADVLNGLGGHDIIYGGDGGDTIEGDGASGSGNDTLQGGGGGDRLHGGGGNDLIHGGPHDAGADTLRGGLGADTMTGGAGGDRFDFNAANEIGNAAGARDVVTDFLSGEDRIDLDDLDALTTLAGVQHFTWLGTAGHTGAGATLRYQQAGGNTLVYGDVNADGAGDFTMQINGLHSLTAADFTNLSIHTVQGTAAADTLTGAPGGKLMTGLAGNDTITGGAGTDTMRGGDGVDFLTGGLGADRFDFNAAAEIGVNEGFRDIVADFQQGIDLIDLDGIDALSTLAGTQHFIFIGTAAHTGAGATLRAYQFFGTTLVAGDVDANGADDFVVQLNGLYGLTAADFTNASIVTVQGTAGDDTLTGGPGGKGMTGLGGNDTITGGAGADTIFGGAAADLMTGAAGADIFKWAAHTHTGLNVGARDIVADFQQGLDRIDLSAIDANTAVAGNQDFIFLGTAPHTGAGATLRYLQTGGNTVVWGDIDANGGADFAIQISGLHTLTAADFVL